MVHTLQFELLLQTKLLFLGKELDKSSLITVVILQRIKNIQIHRALWTSTKYDLDTVAKAMSKGHFLVTIL